MKRNKNLSSEKSFLGNGFCQPSKPIGLLGGTFDPVHFGHLRMATELLQILDLASISFIPCKMPVHKKTLDASAKHRLAMLSLALENSPNFQIDDRELTRESPSFMYKTLESIKKEHSMRPLVLILGSDAFVNLASWKNWETLIESAHIVVAIRAGKKMYLDTEMQRFLNKYLVLDHAALHEKESGSIFIQSITALDIASSMIRCQVQAHYSPQFLLPQRVLNYIHQHQLYRSHYAT